jgi:hypothetical protein
MTDANRARKKIMRSPAIEGLTRRSPDLDFYWSVIQPAKTGLCPRIRFGGHFFGVVLAQYFR